MKQMWILASLLCAATACSQTNGDGESFMKSMSDSTSHMERGMRSAPMNGDVDHDFATMMLPHHQGAVDMAKAELQFGKDPVMRRLAQEIIVDQESEITAMNLWLKKNASSTPKGR